jgi:hypothetical protein
VQRVRKVNCGADGHDMIMSQMTDVWRACNRKQATTTKWGRMDEWMNGSMRSSSRGSDECRSQAG